MTRSNSKYLRIYLNGYDVSGEVNNAGTFGFETDAPMVAAYSDAIKNSVLGNIHTTLGTVNSFLSPSAAIGYHELMDSANLVSDVLLAMGANAVPAVGCPVFAEKFQQTGYSASGEGVVGASTTFVGAAATCPKGYSPFGLLLHANGAETAANTAIGTIDNGAASAAGGVFVYHLLSSDGTVTLSVDDSATNLNNAAFAALSGATSGELDATTTPASGFISLGHTATVRQYLRWQLALGTANTATFVTAFIRG